ncbi:hypothetical protein [Cohnella terricola]|uniref:Uncharacterized protein n=1 Tax=Cohnella terricola TaxID=1289167 RepID=A0A559J8Z8_9BACL|nr:hypothetical protein [Cohnella terricola]TVX96316.1 hypothetical protein FPZ45_21670 [Cohnella terricola]
MKVKLDPKDYESHEISWLCIKPMLIAVRGKDLQTKLEMYNQLNEGQQGLFLFYSFHNHTKTIAEFYWFSAYNINELKSWKGIRKGVLFFKDFKLADRLDEIEKFIASQSKLNRTISPTDLENDRKLFDEVKILHEKYTKDAELTIQLMNEWVLANKSEFIDNG